MAQAYVLFNNEKYKEKAYEKFEYVKSHLEFVLPDGAIDSSFGSRVNKWTYWGSRTSDGMQEGLCLSDDPLFIESAELNARSFNVVGGFLTASLEIKMKANEVTTLKIKL